MTFKIERISDVGGNADSAERGVLVGAPDEVKAEIERAGPRVVLDLQKLDLVNVEGIRLPNACEALGISVLRSSPYIREWMLRERGRPKAPTHTSQQGKGWLKEEDGKQVWRGAVALTSGNEHRRSQSTGRSKERRHSGARHAVHVTQV